MEPHRPRNKSGAGRGPANEARVLVVDDEPGVREVCARMVASMGYIVESAPGTAEAMEAVRERPFSLIISDVVMPGDDGISLLQQVKAFDPGIEVILITGFGSIESAVDAMRLGASDYVTKPLRPDEMKKKIGRTLKQKRLRRENAYLRKVVDDLVGNRKHVGKSPAFKKLLQFIARVGASDATVLIEGETGTGKELVARAVHETGSRSAGPFIPVHCAAVTETVFESELFGHRRGAFTGASASKDGLFMVADGGTLFLDEVSEIPPSIQTKLLRVLQEGEVRPVGDTRCHQVDARVVAATNRNLESAVESGDFREDLYYRLAVLPIRVPPLRERRDDIPLLVSHFLGKQRLQGRGVRGLSDAAMQVLLRYHWPGNVRELENCVEFLIALGSGEMVSVDDLPRRLFSEASVTPDLAAASGFSLDRVEIEAIKAALERNKGKVLPTARELKVGKTTLYRKIKKYNLRG